jgi:hypothetical protein
MFYVPGIALSYVREHLRFDELASHLLAACVISLYNHESMSV